MVGLDRRLIAEATEDGQVGGLGRIRCVVAALEEEEGEIPRGVFHLHEPCAVQQVGDGGGGDLTNAFLLVKKEEGGREGGKGG